MRDKIGVSEIKFMSDKCNKTFKETLQRLSLFNLVENQNFDVIGKVFDKVNFFSGQITKREGEGILKRGHLSKKALYFLCYTNVLDFKINVFISLFKNNFVKGNTVENR